MKLQKREMVKSNSSIFSKTSVKCHFEYIDISHIYAEQSICTFSPTLWKTDIKLIATTACSLAVLSKSIYDTLLVQIKDKQMMLMQKFLSELPVFSLFDTKSQEVLLNSFTSHSLIHSQPVQSMSGLYVVYKGEFNLTTWTIKVGEKANQETSLERAR